MEDSPIEKKSLLDEVDIMALLGKVYAKRMFILCCCAAFFVLGILSALTSVRIYKSEIEVAPETSNSSLASGGLGAIAAMAGLDMGMLGGGDAIYPMLYPDIIESLPFLTSLMEVNVVTQDGAVDTTYAYYQVHSQKKSLFSTIKHFPRNTIKKFIALFASKDEYTVADPLVYDPHRLSKVQMSRIESLQGAINVFVDKKTDVITVAFSDPDPVVASIMADEIMKRLQERITEYRVQKSIVDYNYMEQLYQKAKSEYEEAQEQYASYVDKHQGVVKKQYQVEEDRLNSVMELKNTIYMQWAQQLEVSKAKIQERTPAFTTLKPAAVPAIPSSMRRLMVVILWTFAGGMLSVLYVLLKDPLRHMFSAISDIVKSE